MHIVSLFCEIDDFFLAFENYQARHQLPGTPSEKTGTPPDPTSQRGDDDPSELSPKWVSDLQGLLPQRGMPPLTVGVSRPSELQPLRRTDARDTACLVCLSLHAIRELRWGFFHGFHPTPGLRESAYSKASRLRRTGRSWQDLARMVLWVQTSFTHQHTRRPPRC